MVREIVVERWRKEKINKNNNGSSSPLAASASAAAAAAAATATTTGEEEEEGEGETSHRLFFHILSDHLDDFGDFTALGHVLTTRTKEGEAWVSDVEEVEEGEEGKGGKGGGANTSSLSSPTSQSPRSFCSLAQQAWSWGGVTPEAAVEAERSLRVGW